MTISGVNSVNSAASAANTASAASPRKSDFDTFLTLLTAQLKNQDPANPADSTQLVAQLATFSSVEQQIKTNDKLDSLIAALSTSDYSNLLGKWVSSSDEKTAGKVASIAVDSGSAIATLDNGKTIDLSKGYILRQNAPS